MSVALIGYNRPEPRAYDSNGGRYPSRHISADCSPGGLGMCDGYDYDTYETKECDCRCHNTPFLNFSTIASVSEWHDRENGVGEFRDVYENGTHRVYTVSEAIEKGIEFHEIH